MCFVFRLGGNPYCNSIDSALKSSVCRFNKSSSLLPLDPSNIATIHKIMQIYKEKPSLNNCGFVSYNSMKATLTPIL
jgi:hypothetical protein